MGIAIGRKGRPDLQGGKPPKVIRSGRQITIKANGVPPGVATVNGHSNGKPKKPRGGAAIPVVEDDSLDAVEYTEGSLPGEMGPPIKTEAVKAPEQPESETKIIPIGRIDPSPTNPRQHFDEAKLAELADSIRQVGLLQPILVRPKLHRWEIVAGERRWRAAQLAKLEQVECKVRWLDDWQALKVQWTENAERDDINEIDEAKHFQRMLDARDGLTQQQLADELGTSQGQIANRLRLLELPEDWQQRVISQEISATHGREIVPFVGHDQALEDIAEQIKFDGTAGSVKQFREELEAAVRHKGIQLNGSSYDSATGEWVNWRVPLTAQQRNDWRVVELKSNGAKILFAASCDDAQKAADFAKQFRIDEARKKKKKSAAAKPGESPASAKKRADDQFAKRLTDWKTDWLRVLCAARLAEKDNARLAGMFFLAMSLEYHVWQCRIDQFEDAAERAGSMKLERAGSIYEKVRQAAVCVELEDLHTQFAIGLLVDPDDGSPLQIVDRDDVEDLANELELPADLEAIWHNDQAGALSEAYWSLHTIDQLNALGEELGIEWRATGKKGMVVQLLESKSLRLPQELGGGKKPRKRKGAR